MVDTGTERLGTHSQEVTIVIDTMGVGGICYLPLLFYGGIQVYNTLRLFCLKKVYYEHMNMKVVLLYKCFHIQVYLTKTVTQSDHGSRKHL